MLCMHCFSNAGFLIFGLVLRNSFIKLWVNQNIFPELQQGFILLEVIYTF